MMKRQLLIILTILISCCAEAATLDPETIYTVDYTTIWSELHLYYTGRTLSLDDYSGIRVELPDTPESNAWSVKVYGAYDGKEQYVGIKSKQTTVNFNNSSLGGKVTRITLQSSRNGKHTLRVKPATLIRKDGTEELCAPSVFWGCEITKKEEPDIARGYYYIGELNHWDSNDKSYPFKLAADGETWEITIMPTSEDEWFKIVPDYVFRHQDNFWNMLLCAPYDGCEEQSGNMTFGAFGAWLIKKNSAYQAYTIRINPTTMHYDITGHAFEPEESALLLINELMQSNIDCLMDDLNDFPDSWVELYNPLERAVDLMNFKLGITPNASEAWQLPPQMISPGGHAIVYCDKVGDRLHTPFRLESGKGCEVYLFKGEQVVDKITGLKKQPAPNIAYGRKTDGADEWGYQLSSTPGTANSGAVCDIKQILGEPVFSEPARVTTSGAALTLALSLPDGTPEGTIIRYTTNGSEPTESSTPYSRPLSIASTTTVRAKLFCDGWLSPRSTTRSYIYFPRELTLPVVSINTDDKYLNDPAIGIYVEGANKEEGDENFRKNWRRPINFELFEADGSKSALNQLCEMRIMGGWTRGNPLKSLALYANKRFGTKRFAYEFFPDQKPGLTDFKSIALRDAGNDFDYLYQRDAIIQRTMAQHADLDWQAWKPIIIYINGTYRGILNIRERSNDDNIYTNYDGLEDIDMIENWWELKNGDWDSYNQFRDFFAQKGHTLAEYEQRMDWKEFINLMAMNLYFDNQDFPQNNIVMWRPRTKDGRWRWIAKDADFGLGLYDKQPTENTINWLHHNEHDPYTTLLFRQLMEDGDFKREFLDRCAIYMGDFLNEKGTRAIWDPMYEMIRYEYPYHRNLYNQWWPNYNDELTKARNWLAKRTNEFYKQLANFYALGTPVPLTINQSMSADEAPCVTFNGVELSAGSFDGKFFASHTIELTGEAPEGKALTGWHVTRIETNGSSTSQDVTGTALSLTMPQCSRMIISANLSDSPAGISTPTEHAWKWTATGDAIYITGVAVGTRICLYDLRGMLLYKATATSGSMMIPSAGSRQTCILNVGGETVKILLP